MDTELDPMKPLDLDAALNDLVACQAPRSFAVVQVYRDGEDGRVAAWGLAFEDDGHADIVNVEAGRLMRVRSLERGLRAFAHSPDITTRLVWLDQATG
jgi:hypothetical protein